MHPIEISVSTYVLLNLQTYILHLNIPIGLKITKGLWRGTSKEREMISFFFMAKYNFTMYHISVVYLSVDGN